MWGFMRLPERPVWIAAFCYLCTVIHTDRFEECFCGEKTKACLHNFLYITISLTLRKITTRFCSVLPLNNSERRSFPHLLFLSSCLVRGLQSQFSVGPELCIDPESRWSNCAAAVDKLEEDGQKIGGEGGRSGGRGGGGGWAPQSVSF